jgi:Family of unknown function (DUF6544)
MRHAFSLFLVVHGLIHLLGFAKAYGYAELPQLSRPVSHAAGLLWLVAALLFLASAVAVYVWPRGWWVLGAAGIVVSMVVVMPAWTDAKFGAAANALVLVGVAFGCLAFGPTSLRATYERDVAAGLARPTPSAPVTAGDLARLPDPVRIYLQRAGVVGRPRVWSVYVRMHGRIRSGPADGWMPLVAEQYDFFDEPSRFFYLNASMYALPVQGYHRYAGTEATMRIKAAALVPVVDASGPEMTRGETVTLFNDMCLFAPATLIDPGIGWEPVDARTARATFRNAGYTIHAELTFNAAGELVNFRSDDRGQVSRDGTVVTLPWSTPMGAYRDFHGTWLGSEGTGRWQTGDADYAYIELIVDDVQYNVTRR